MSRSGYFEDDGDDPLAMGRWRGVVASAIRGKRGQELLRDILAALEAMPVKELAAESLVNADGEFCTLGVLGSRRGIDIEALDPEDYDEVANAFGVAAPLVQEIVYINDGSIAKFKYQEFEICGPMQRWENRTSFRCIPTLDAGNKRWHYMHSWVTKQIISEVAP